MQMRYTTAISINRLKYYSIIVLLEAL